VKQRRILLFTVAALAAVGVGLLIIPGLNRGSLTVSARLVYTDGQAQAVAGEAFYLLDADPLRLLIDGDRTEGRALASQVSREHPRLEALARVLDARRRYAYPLGAEVGSFVEDARPVWERHVVQSAGTDREGRARFQNLRPGDYWLMGRAPTRGGLAFWNLPVRVERGSNQLSLEPDNSLECSSCLVSPWASARENAHP
jgi:hypothetical protein